MANLVQKIIASNPPLIGYRIIDCTSIAKKKTNIGDTPTQARLKYLLNYNPDTGEFTWRVDRPRVKAGDTAGKMTGDGYVAIGVDGRRYSAHRLAFLYMTGVLPDGIIDHRNLNRCDNSWSNLRLATDSQNQANTPLKTNNTSGFKGVSWSKRDGRWRADIRIDGKKTTLGSYPTPQEAHAAYKAAATAHHGRYARAA